MNTTVGNITALNNCFKPISIKTDSDIYKLEFEFASAMQHYEVEPVGDHHPTATVPSKESLFTILENSFGLRSDIDKKECARLREKYTLSIRPIQMDFPLVISTLYEEDKTGKSKSVDYLFIACFSITILGKKEDLMEAKEALLNPRYTYTFGGSVPSKLIFKEIEKAKN